jgi:hypothetical protein
MREDFYLRQRWYNNVQLGDRAFISHEGVASLNFEDGDKLLFTPDGTVRVIRQEITPEDAIGSDTCV